MEEIFITNELEKREILDNKIYDVAVIGGGPSGVTAALYTSRSNLTTIVLDKAPGTGALALTHKIANYPSQSGDLSGEDLLNKMRVQAKEFGAIFVQSMVQGVMDGEEYKTLFTPDGMIQAKAVYIAIGARGGRKNKIVGEDEFLGRGVSYCATCDANFYKGKIAGVIGDNEEAIEEALVLQKFASKVKIFVPTNKIAGSIDPQILEQYNNIEVNYTTRIKEISGDDFVNRLIDTNGNVHEVDGAFIYLSGNMPNTDFLNSILELTEDGYIKTNDSMETSLVGIFAGGDIRKPPIKQVVVAASDGAIAAMSIEKLLRNKAILTPQYN